jgi:hypothetical protein
MRVALKGLYHQTRAFRGHITLKFKNFCYLPSVFYKSAKLISNPLYALTNPFFPLKMASKVSYLLIYTFSSLISSSYSWTNHNLFVLFSLLVIG